MSVILALLQLAVAAAQLVLMVLDLRDRKGKR